MNNEGGAVRTEDFQASVMRHPPFSLDLSDLGDLKLSGKVKAVLQMTNSFGLPDPWIVIERAVCCLGRMQARWRLYIESGRGFFDK